MGFRASVQLHFMPLALGEEAGLLLYRDLDAQLFFTIRNGIGQTTGQSSDVSRLYEKQEYEGLYLQIDQCENGFRQKLFQTKLNMGKETKEPLTLSLYLDEDTHQISFSFVNHEGTLEYPSLR